MNSMKNGSSAIVLAGRASTSPHASARSTERARAARLGYQPSSRAISRIRSLVPSETPGGRSARRRPLLGHAGALRDVTDRHSASALCQTDLLPVSGLHPRRREPPAAGRLAQRRALASSGQGHDSSLTGSVHAGEADRRAGRDPLVSRPPTSLRGSRGGSAGAAKGGSSGGGSHAQASSAVTEDRKRSRRRLLALAGMWLLLSGLLTALGLVIVVSRRPRSCWWQAWP